MGEGGRECGREWGREGGWVGRREEGRLTSVLHAAPGHTMWVEDISSLSAQGYQLQKSIS